MGFPTFSTVFKGLWRLALVSVIATAGLLYRYQRLLIYPANVPPGSRHEVMTPDELGMPYTEEKLKTPDGETIRLYLIQQDGSVERQVNNNEPTSATGNEAAKYRPTVLILHANAGNMGHRLPLAKVFHRRFAFNVVMLSYRGYGLSTGSPSEQGIRTDAHAALAYIRSHPILSQTVLVVYGQSLGGAVAIDLAANFHDQVDGAILENTFTSMPDLVPHVLPPLRPFTFLCRDTWPSVKRISRFAPKAPVLFLSGTDDELVPPAQMETLYKRCNSSRKHWIPILQGMHNDTCAQPGYFDHVATWIKTYIIPLASERATMSAALAASQPKAMLGQQLQPTTKPLSQDEVAGTTTTTGETHQDLRKRVGTSAVTTPDELTGDEGEWVKMSAGDATAPKL